MTVEKPTPETAQPGGSSEDEDSIDSLMGQLLDLLNFIFNITYSMCRICISMITFLYPIL